MQANPAEVRFYGRTSAHSRVVHFKTWETSVIDYFTTGSGSVAFASLKTKYMALSGHTATLPMSATSAAAGQGNTAATNLPFYSASNYWVMRGGYWSVDDTSTTGSDTIHQMWVRAAPTTTTAPGELCAHTHWWIAGI